MFAQPPVGSNIVVVTKHRDYYYYRTSDWRLTEYSGTVLKSEKWDAPNTFRMTGDDNHPVRVIWLSDIDSLVVDGSNGQTQDQKHSKVKTVTVKGSKGNEYVVMISPKGNQCTCPAFVFRKQVVCKHIKEVIETNV